MEDSLFNELRCCLLESGKVSPNTPYSIPQLNSLLTYSSREEIKEFREKLIRDEFAEKVNIFKNKFNAYSYNKGWRIRFLQKFFQHKSKTNVNKQENSGISTDLTKLQLCPGCGKLLHVTLALGDVNIT